MPPKNHCCFSGIKIAGELLRRHEQARKPNSAGQKYNFSHWGAIIMDLGSETPYAKFLERLKEMFEQLFAQGQSLRAIARKIEMDPGTLSRILSGKRRINIQQAILILERLAFGDKDKKEIIELLVKDSLQSTISAFNKHYESTTNQMLPKEIILEAINSLSDDVNLP